MNEMNEITSQDETFIEEPSAEQALNLGEVLDDIPTEISHDEPADENEAIEPEKKTRKPKQKGGGFWIWGAILFLVLALLVAGFFGYRRGIAWRMERQRQQEMQMIEAQLALYFGDMGKENYENAFIRLDWIKKLKPNFPGIDDMMAEVSQKIGYVPTSIPNDAPPVEGQDPVQQQETPTPKPMLDIAAAEAMFTAIQQAVNDQNWDLAVEKILEIKEKAFEHKRILVDGYYFIALRNRGISRIWAGQLEQGMYDLSVVDSLGALDKDADGAYQWAANYITATSYWDTNWEAAVNAFSTLYSQTPYFAESGGMTVTERYRIALYKRGEEYALREEWCTAADFYKRSIEVGLNLDIQVTAVAYAEYCANPPGQSTPEPTGEAPVEGTPTPGDADPTAEPTEEPAP